MSKQRFVDPKLWSDPWMRKLNPLDRYLFIYLLTNERSSWCGVYELDLSIMAFESGIDERDLEKSMLPRLAPKVLYIDRWVCFKNWEKYHNNGSEQTQKGIQNAWEAVPKEIRLKIKRLSTIKIPPIDPLGGGSSLTSTSTFTSASKYPATRGVAGDTKFSKEGAEIIKAFELFNPVCGNFYGNTTQRGACDRLIASRTLEKTLRLIARLPETNKKDFFPVITTPLQLEQKWVSWASALKREQNAK